MRLNRHLSQCGVGSRRGCEQIILEGRVSINGHVVKELATQVSPTDQVVVDGKLVQPADGIVVAFHKPKGYICSRGDTHDRATIYAILPPQYQTLHYVGRLDKESEGLLLLTNRGELSQRLTHPSEGVEKEYEVTIDSDFAPEHKLKLLHGMLTEEGFAKAERVWVDSARRINVVLKQGLKRQIRLMFYQLGYEVERLVRRRIGGLYLKGMPKGAWKELTDAEVQRYFIKHKEREPAARPVKAKQADGEGEDSFASEPTPAAAAPFKLRPGPKASVRKPRRLAAEGEAELERPARFGKKPGRSAGPRSRTAERTLDDRELPSQPQYDSDMPSRSRSAPHKPKRFTKSREMRSDSRAPERAASDDAAPSRGRPSPHKPKRFTKSRELRSDHGAPSEYKPRRASDGPMRPFSKPERIVGEEDSPRPRSRTGGMTPRQASRKNFGERSKAGGKPAFAKKKPFKAGNKAPRKGGKK